MRDNGDSGVVAKKKNGTPLKAKQGSQKISAVPKEG